MRRTAALLTLVLTIVLTFGCAASRQARKVDEPRGFLGEYEGKLSRQDDTPVLLSYVNKGADWSVYDKVMIDAVQFWRSADVEAGLKPAEAQALANYMHHRLVEELGKRAEIVSIPQEGALRLSVAFTRLGDRNVTLDTVSTYVPQMRLLSEVKTVFTGKPSFVGEATMEAKVVDAATGELMGAAVDTQVGGKTIKNFDDWADVRAAIDTWAKVMGTRLCMVKGGQDCV